jgi:hypothetical protein
MAFQYKGQYSHSSHIPSITHEQKEITRADFHAHVVQATVDTLPAVEGDPVYIATGGGYGSNDPLIAYLKSAGKIDTAIPSIKGADFRNHPSFDAEKADVLSEIQAGIQSSRPEAAEQIRSAFYSDEVNTKLAKEVVKAAIAQGKSVIHESASIYPDTIERAQLAKAHGVKTILIAGDREHTGAIAALKSTIEPKNTATSYKQFSKRFDEELVPLFDEIQLYNTDQNPPLLIAQKKGAGKDLEIYNAELYAQFKARAKLDPDKYATPTAAANVIGDENAREFPGKGRKIS